MGLIHIKVKDAQNFSKPTPLTLKQAMLKLNVIIVDIGFYLKE